MPGIEDPISGRRWDPIPAGEDPSPATTSGKPPKLPGVLGHTARCVSVIDDPFSGRRRPVFRPVETRFRPPSPGRPPGCRARWGCVSEARARHSFAELVLRSGSPIAPHSVVGVLGAASSRELEARLTQRAWSAMVGDRAEGCSRRGRGIELPGLRPCVGPPRDP